MRAELGCFILAFSGLASVASAQRTALPSLGAGTDPLLKLAAVHAVQLPEPSGLALLAVDLLSFGILIFMLRRRESGKIGHGN